ncbi:low molecular weight phosphatase family protein [Microbacterium sp. HMWF026]|uniref:arsenate reductase/protein-tyrosine-phosphatase family protein n=1 Tax=Microbacterium sp. HMWF026 TaxID=2056861 RepID=UPI0015E7ECA7|nr:low molecular weight phosphatase family protein [Microbacterium sp. HMWF026]
MNLLKILFVCTGNICRSPIAEQLLSRRFEGTKIQVDSAGTRARAGVGMTPEAIQFAGDVGVPVASSKLHRSSLISTARLVTADLALAMTREHRRQLVEMEPAAVRRVFTLRELDRLLDGVSDGELEEVVHPYAASAPALRLAQLLSFVASRRGTLLPPMDSGLDDVVDPFGRSVETYRVSVRQITEALPAAERVLRLALA